MSSKQKGSTNAGTSASTKTVTKKTIIRNSKVNQNKPAGKKRNRRRTMIKKTNDPKIVTNFAVSSLLRKERAAILMLEKLIVEYLLGAVGQNTGFVYQRDDTRPVFQKLIPFTKVLSSRYWDTDKCLAMNVHPNPFRALELVIPPTEGNRSKDLWESMTIQTHASNPISWCFDKDITCIVGSVKAASHIVRTISGLKHYSTDTEEFKDGNKVYATGSSTFIVPSQVSVSNTASYAITVGVRMIAVLGPANDLYAGQVASASFTVNGNEQTVANVDSNFDVFSADMASAEAYGFMLVFDVSSSSPGTEITMTGSTWSLSLSQASEDPERHPIFGSAYTIESHSAFDIIGNPALGLKTEIETADQMAVTGYSLLVQNFTAQLNKAGRVLGVEVPANHTKNIPLAPLSRIATVQNLPKNPMTMTSALSVDNGLHFSNIMTRDFSEFTTVETFRTPEDSNYRRPYATVIIDGKGAFDPSSYPDISVQVWLNVEWRSGSMTMTPIKPGSNVGRFTELLATTIGKLPDGSLWGENPTHLNKIRNLASRIVKSDTFKTVVRDVALVGVESLTAALL